MSTSLTAELDDTCIYSSLHFCTVSPLALTNAFSFAVLRAQIFLKNIEYKLDYYQNEKVLRLVLDKNTVAEIPSDKVKELGDHIDDELALSEETHRFINYEEMEKAANGDSQMMFFVFNDWINDPEKRNIFFKKYNIEEPEQRYYKN